jgi:hypothetical protein
MDEQERLPAPEADDEPQIFKPKKEGRRWTFSRGDFLKLAIAAGAGAIVNRIPGVKNILGRRVQLVAHATELSESSLQPGKLLTKVWYLKNNSELPWGEGAVMQLGGATTWQTTSSIPLPNLAPGETTTVRVSMVAPDRLDPRPFEAVIKVADEDFKVYLPIIHKPAEEEPPCTCESYVPCTCDTEGGCGCDSYSCGCVYDFPCGCDYYTCPCVYDFCACDYDIPCPCVYDFCACDYDIPCPCVYDFCACDYDIPCLCDYDCGCVGYVPCSCDFDCGCVGYVPCPCNVYFPCSCDYYIPCGCVAYIPCGCVYYFP